MRRSGWLCAGVTAALGVAALAFWLHSIGVLSSHYRRKCCCVANLKFIGMYLTQYVSRYGGEVSYPPTGGYPNFLNYLREIPSRTLAVSAVWDCNFACTTLGTKPGPGVLDYRYPAAGRMFSETTFHLFGGYSGGTPSDAPVACDRATNHSAWYEGDDINVLLFDGSVKTVSPGDLFWDSCVGAGSAAWMEGPE